jgi:hypothetical protein
VSRAALTALAGALVLAALALLCSGCETTAEKSAKLEKAAKRVALAQQTGLSITRQSTVVKVTSASVVRGAEGSAAIVTLRNSSAKALRDVPLAITLKDARGSSVYSNDTPGLAKTLTSVALLPAHGEITWIDDQIAARAANSVSANVGEGAAVDDGTNVGEGSAAAGGGGGGGGGAPRLELQGTHLAEDPGGGVDAEGTIVNRSRVEQSELVIYAVARRRGRVVAAGRAVLASLAAGASTPFQIFFVGDPKGAQLQLSVPPTTLG